MENENSKLVEIVAQHTVEIANIKEDVVELKDTQKMIYEMNGNIKSLVEKIGDTNEEIGGIKNDIRDLRIDMNDVKNKDDKKDAKKWNGLVKQIITIVLSAIVGLVLAKIGLI